MADLSAYKDLSKAPLLGDSEDSTEAKTDTPSKSDGFGFLGSASNTPAKPAASFSSGTPSSGGFAAEVKRNLPMAPSEDEARTRVDTEFGTNVQTLIRLVNELPEGVTKQTGAQIIRLTMEAMGISMEEVLSEAQSAQSDMLDAVRANIKKIEEFKTVIRKLEHDIKFYQGKANELSEIIDLFILSNASSAKVTSPSTADSGSTSASSTVSSTEL